MKGWYPAMPGTNLWAKPKLRYDIGQSEFRLMSLQHFMMIYGHLVRERNSPYQRAFRIGKIVMANKTAPTGN